VGVHYAGLSAPSAAAAAAAARGFIASFSPGLFYAITFGGLAPPFPPSLFPSSALFLTLPPSAVALHISSPFNSAQYAELYPQNGDRVVTIDSVTSLHPMYISWDTALEGRRGSTVLD